MTDLNYSDLLGLVLVAAIMVFGVLGILSFELTVIFLLTAIAIFVQ